MFQPFIEPTMLPCGHFFCFSCIKKWRTTKLSSFQTPDCPVCRAQMPFNPEVIKLNLLGRFIDELVDQVFDDEDILARAAVARVCKPD